jgi:hypothetical protein
MPSSIANGKYLKLGHNEPEVDFIDREAHKAIRISAQTILNKVVRHIKKDPDAPLNYRELVWPTINSANFRTSAGLRLVPLERIGVEQGRSGSKVMLAYFVKADSPHSQAFWSTPMVLKIAKTGSSADRKLRAEEKNARVVKRFATHEGRFAFPFAFSDGTKDRQSYSVLWSRFTHAGGDDGYWCLDDLRNLLKGRCRVVGATAEKVVSEAVKLLRPLHSKGLVEPQPVKLNLVKHYRWYLREVLDGQLEWPTKRVHWTALWKKMWGPHTQEKVSHLGTKWTNPFWVLDRLRKLRDQSLLCGVVHGDLHPRNIVLAGSAEPHIIDFGWAGDRRHISQDFVLLECNLRFFVQEPALALADLRAMAAWISFDQQIPDLTGELARGRVRLINLLREAARSHFPPNTNWDVEYVVPLFLISLGLLKHMSDCENQLAGHLTILSLANYVAENLLPKPR